MKNTTTTIMTLVNLDNVSEYLSKGFEDIKTLKLDDVVKNPIEFKNVVIISALKDTLDNAINEYNAHVLNMNKSENVVKNAELDKKLGIFSAYDEKQMKTYNNAVKFLVDADMKKVMLQDKKEALTKKYNELTTKEYSEKLADIMSDATRLQNFLLIKSLVTGNYSKIANVFKPCLESARIYKACKARQIEEKEASYTEWEKTCKELYMSFKKECELLFNLYNCTEENDPYLSKRSIRMNSGELNNLATMVSGLSIDMNSDGVMKMSATSISTFNKVLVKVLIMKKQNIKLVLEK